MKTGSSSKATLGKLLFRVTALVVARLRGDDLRVVLKRLETEPRTLAIAKVAAVVAGLFILALLAASFGVWGLLCYFAAVLILFR